MRALGPILGVVFIFALFVAMMAFGVLAFVAQAILLGLEAIWRRLTFAKAR